MLSGDEVDVVKVSVVSGSSEDAVEGAIR